MRAERRTFLVQSFLWIALWSTCSLALAQRSALLQQAAAQLQVAIDTASIVLYLDPRLTTLFAPIDPLPDNFAHPATLGLLYVTQYDQQGTPQGLNPELPPGWYRLRVFSDNTTLTVELDDNKGHSLSVPATLDTTRPPSPDDAALRVGLVASRDALELMIRLGNDRLLRFHIPRAATAPSTTQADTIEALSRRALLQTVAQLRRLSPQIDTTRTLIVSTDNVVLAGALEPGLDLLTDEALRQGVSFAVLIAARKYPGRRLGEAVRFELQRFDSTRYVLRRLDALGKTIATDTLERRIAQRPLTTALYFNAEVGAPPEICLGLSVSQEALCFLWPLTAEIPTQVAAVPGDGSVVLTWAAARGAVSYNVYLAAEAGVNKDNWQNKLEGRKLEAVNSPLVITGLQNDRTYYFVVTAVGVRGESRESNEVTAVPQASPYQAEGPRSGGDLPRQPIKLGPPLQGQTLVEHDGAVAIIIAPQELTMEPGEVRTLDVWVEDTRGNRFAGSSDYLELVTVGSGWSVQWAGTGKLHIEAPAAHAVEDSLLVLEVRSRLLPDSTYYAGQALIRLVQVRSDVVVVPEEKVVWPVNYPLHAEAIARRRSLFTDLEWNQAERPLLDPPGLMIGVALQEDTLGQYQAGQKIVSKGEGFSLGGQIEHVIARRNGYVLLGVRLLPLEALYVSYPFPDLIQLARKGISPVNPNAMRTIWPDELKEQLFKTGEPQKAPCNYKVKLSGKLSGKLERPGIGSGTIGLGYTFEVTCEWKATGGSIEAEFSLDISGALHVSQWDIVKDSQDFYRALVTLDYNTLSQLLEKVQFNSGIAANAKGSVSIAYQLDLPTKGPTYLIPIGLGIYSHQLFTYTVGLAIRITIIDGILDGIKEEILGSSPSQSSKTLEILSAELKAALNTSANIGKLIRLQSDAVQADISGSFSMKVLDLISYQAETDVLNYYKANFKLSPFTIGPILGFVQTRRSTIAPLFAEETKVLFLLGLGLRPYLTISPQGVTDYGTIVNTIGGKQDLTKSRIAVNTGTSAELVFQGELVDFVSKILEQMPSSDLISKLQNIIKNGKIDLKDFKFWQTNIGDIALEQPAYVDRTRHLVSGTLKGYYRWAEAILLYQLQSNQLYKLGEAAPRGKTFQVSYDPAQLDCSTPDGGKAHLVSSVDIPVLSLRLPLGFSYLGEVDLCNPEFSIQPSHLEFIGQKGDRLQQTVRAIAKDAGTVTVSVSNTQGPFTLTPTQATITPPDSAATFTVQTACTDERLGQRLTGSATFTFTTDAKQVQRTLSLSLSCQDADNPNDNPPIAGDRPPARGGSWGDPHITTFDRLGYDFHAIGDYLAVRSTLPGDLFEIQVRHKPWANSNRVSVNAALAANVDGHRVEVYPDSATNLLAIWINGQRMQGAHFTQPLSGGGSVVAQGTQVIISWKDGSALTVRRRGSILDYRVLVSGFRRGHLIGLLGDADGNPSNDLRLQDGTVLNNPLERDLYLTTFREDWRIPFGSDESLFSQGPDLYDPLFPDPNNLFTVEDLPEELRSWAELVCLSQGIVTETF
ncbi:VWD domain-containing protein, partial [Rhodothermus profundi]